ncbi:antitoxin [Knoellia locipacati]|uniref:antitoxin n=1 Tax=Knoellia locipacati TaxID=882824 RepID=UPI00384DF0A9
MSMFDKAKEFIAEHSDKLDEHSEAIEQHSDRGLDQAGDFAESKGLGADHVDQGRDVLDERIGERGEATNPEAGTSEQP